MKWWESYKIEHWGELTFCKLNLITEVSSMEYENKRDQMNRPLNRMATTAKDEIRGIIAIYAMFNAEIYEN